MAAMAEKFPRNKIFIWIRALRPQFYPMTWLAYTMGALGAATVTGNWNLSAFWLGYMVPLFLEAATVLTNELFDYESDRYNLAYSPFNGGSRVLVTDALSKGEVVIGIVVTVLATLASGAFLMSWLDVGIGVPVLLAAMLVLGPGYTMPPLKLAWRGLGELDVALTHSPGAVLWGYLIQGAAWNDPFPWLVGIPMMLAILPAILVAGMPDLEADRRAGKITLVVRLGRRRTTLLALAITLFIPPLVLALQDLASLHGAFDHLFLWAAMHSAALSVLLCRYWLAPEPGRIDGLLVVTLSYTLWFALIPILNLL